MLSAFKFSLNRLRNKQLFGNDSSAPQGEQIYLAPEFSPDVLKAVRLISTCLHLTANEKSRLLWQAESNAASLVEYEALLPLFAKMQKPKKILEVGPGLGRSAVIFGKKKVWNEDATVHLYDTDGSRTKYKQKHYDRPPKWPDVSSFCGNLELLDTILKYNGVSNCTIFDAAQNDLKTLPGPYDLIYGFYSIGFHWSIEHYLDDLEPLMDRQTVILCTLNKHFTAFPKLASYSTRVLQAAGTKKGSRPLSFLALSKSALPEVGLSVEEAFSA
jgi:predicted O-methyltransferase YrrM